MSKAFVASKPGGPEVLVWTDIDTPPPGPGEVRVRHTAIGVNFIDVYFRSGLYAWPEPTMIPGAEAAGVVEALGEGVSGFAPGDRVAYVMRHGAYRTERNVPASQLVRIPDALSDAVAASVMLKGLTTQYLVTSSYAVKPGDTVLVHAAAGGVGLLLGQWLKALGAVAIGTAGSAEKVALAREHGYSHVINYREQDFVAEVQALTQRAGCAVAYDSVGNDTWRGSLQCLRRFGMFVNFGQSSGPIQGFALSDLAKGSLSANRPMLFDYIAERGDLERRSAELFRRILAGEVRTDRITQRPLAEVADVHRDLEARKTTGSMVLVP
ncbi:quinone oxidoreductase family protein [Pseudaminobacter soli (ex Li et al. 2025)]|uniref:Quinone oxidoreductase n=1 Tax=Pseudaminobacter soli (ex Li et al. 2025) TaxID=1295366 RepID=A0A2P7SKJ9_9HYPH|nr:quinone oxidoreductase [Mesorhizobium soli]PSJ62905.1 quinone oxidoreductase [Mesorhizobium soli]